MGDDISGRFGLGPIDQVAYAVEDIAASLPRYEAIYGPFEVSEADLPDCTIRGQQASCKLKMAINNSGPVEIELIEVLEGETPHTEHLRDHGEGLHHIRFRVTGLDEKVAALEQEGFQTLLYKRFGPEVVFAYMETPAELGGSLVELLEMP